MEKQYFIELIDKYLSQTATPAEQRLLEEYYAHLAAKGPEGFEADEDTTATGEAIRAEILKRITPEKKTGTGYLISMRYRKFAWIAAIFTGVLLCAGGWYLGHNKRGKKAEIVKAEVAPQNDIVPGGDKAVLTLGDGTRIVLDTARNGTVTAQGNMKVMKLADGQLAYGVAGNNSNGGNVGGQNASGGDANGGNVNGRKDDPVSAGYGDPGLSKIVYNTLTTPRGGQYKIVLSDGSRVWLNAASSLRYPSAFTGKERAVEVTGEAYFEVSPDEHKPFTVRANGTEVQVLGTQFNIMAYENEAEQHITLASGGVRVSKANSSRVLKPGQQARLSSSENIRVVEDADVDEALAWTNNLFSFNDASIETVMQQLARWYDVDVKYAGIVSQHFNGNIPRSVSLSRVFVMLELTGKVHFRIEGRQIIVSPV